MNNCTLLLRSLVAMLPKSHFDRLGEQRLQPVVVHLALAVQEHDVTAVGEGGTDGPGLRHPCSVK